MYSAKILIIEDNPEIVEILDYNLKLAGYEILQSLDGQDGLNQARIKCPDLIVLDVMLPVLDGIEVCKRIRSDPATREISVLMLTAKSEESDQLVGFTAGADDYVTKPFKVKIVLERIKALLRRRTDARLPGETISRCGITVDRGRHRITIDGQVINLTRSEFRLLETLIRQPGRVFNRSELIDAALGQDTIVMERTIDVHIRALRKKLGERANVVETVRGVGYRFCDSTDEG